MAATGEEERRKDAALPAEGLALHHFRLLGASHSAAFFCDQLATHVDTDSPWALRRFSKAEMTRLRQSLERQRAVLRLLADVDVPGVPRLVAHFQDADSVYFVLRPFGQLDLFGRLRQQGRCPEADARLYVAQLVLGLERMHERGVVHRTLGVDGIFIDPDDGYLQLGDLSGARPLPEGARCHTLLGISNALTPEILLNRGYGRPADWFALGWLLVELLTGLPPFPSAEPDPLAFYELILSGRIGIPEYVGSGARSLAKRLLRADPKDRLAGGAEVRAHRWFRGLDWAALEARALAMPSPPPSPSPALGPAWEEVEPYLGPQGAFSSF